MIAQLIPSSPREAIQLIRTEIERLETQPWVRNFQAVGTGSAPATASAAQQTAEMMQRVGLGYTTLTSWAIEAAAQSSTRMER